MPQRIGKYSCLEVERRYLLHALPDDLADAPWKLITDLYLPDTRLRLRRVADQAGRVLQRKLTQKFTDAAQTDTETTITTLYLSESDLYLSESEYQKLLPLSGLPLEKRRYTLPAGAHHYSIDVFTGQLAGLITAEIEFESAEAANTHLPPPFAVREVTTDARYHGGSLARLTAHDVRDLIG